MKDLTPRQAEILQLIRDTISETGMPPTRAEICAALGFSSPNAAEEHLRALQRKGAIEMLGGTARGIRLTESLGLPLIGRVAAGSPSMRDAGILDGDLLAVHRTEEARTGQIVVARVHDEVTVKRFRRRGATVELLPENPDFEPIVVDTREEPLAIEGIGVGVIRNGRSL